MESEEVRGKGVGLDWRMTICSVGDGYIIRKGEGEDAEWQVIEDSWERGEKDSAEARAALLWAVAQYFDIAGSKHDKYRVIIEVVKGEKE